MVLHKKYNLRDLEEKDLEKVLEWRNSKRIRKYMFNDHIITMDEHQFWFKKVKESKDIVVKIFEIGKRPVGLINITNIDKYNKICHWGFYLGEANLPAGTGTIMGYLALEYIFQNLWMRKLYSEILAANNLSLNYHKKLGFIEEGILRKHIFKNGIYEDVIIMSIFRETWLKVKIDLEKICFGGEFIES